MIFFNIFAQNIHCGYTLEPPRRCGSNEYPQCFGSKIRKLGIHLQTPVLLYKSGVKGVFIARTCFPDGFGCRRSFSYFFYQTESPTFSTF